MNLLFILVGLAAAIAGTALLVRAIRGGVEGDPRRTAMLIGGMMLAAFGMLIAGFAIGYSATSPLDLNSAEGAR